ncbi:MAG: hypothetical protein IT302_09395 [Dehalococcoidia bacterium]|nr:hypothetical protein [Dehalococcoidia bacterium]
MTRSARIILAGAGALVVVLTALFAACGDGPDKPPQDLPATRTPTSAGTPRPTLAQPTIGLAGPTPRLGGNVTKLSPAHGATVSQASTRTIDPSRPGGLCFEASFEGLPENSLWFRLRLDEQELTTKMTWVVDSFENPTAGRGCYAPTEGLPVGLHNAAVAVQNPNSATEPTKQLVVWAFEVR